ncbi:MAG: methylmalonyl Co-A mutase-associated GTPase MeaB [Gemmatimonadetes bacterium]|nr:methylmalonyl Co-A mutase-associated GTPase MeaB [Gemmatimonadota bacterium]
MDQLARAVLEGEPRALARAISVVESGAEGASHLIDLLYPHSGGATTIGVTGAPGAGKSTLVDRLIEGLRAEEKSVAAVAIDPSSPFTGGALLGDRVRMMRHHADDGVFIRSMANRGRFGGLAPTTRSVVHLLDAAGFDVVIVETVGVGQAEVSVAGSTMSTVLVLVPGQGDAIQALKAGVMEVADIFVVNKADREGADRMVSAIESVLQLADPLPDRTPPVLRTCATRGDGIAPLLEALDGHRAWLRKAKRLQDFRIAAAEEELRDALGHHLTDRAIAALDEKEAWIERLASREVALPRLIRVAVRAIRDAPRP